MPAFGHHSAATFAASDSDAAKQTVSWPHPEGEKSIKLLPGKTYVRPSGYQVYMEKPAVERAYHGAGGAFDCVNPMFFDDPAPPEAAGFDLRDIL